MRLTTDSNQDLKLPTVGLNAVCLALQEEPYSAVLDLGGHETMVTWGSGPVLSEQDDWLSAIRSTQHTDATHHSGWMGWLGYEAGCHFERMPSRFQPNEQPPALCLWRYQGYLIHHHDQQRWSIWGEPTFQRQARELLDQATDQAPPFLRPGPGTPHTAQQADHFQQGVKKALQHIQEGHVYQVNLSWEVQGLKVENALHSYLQLRESNPAARGAFIQANEWTILSNSPELFFQTEKTANGLRAESVPIKGTAPAQRPHARQTLSESPKEQAELTMITDLVRNDLGRVSRPGTVRASPRRIRVCGDLFHAEQSVESMVSPGLDSLDVLSACFPPGSVTGAPKVRAMELIHEIEGRARGVYTGAIGFFMDNGNAHWNVAIRTASIHNGIGRFHIGAGIVADSDPEQEWFETLAKGNMLARWLQAQHE